MAVCRRGEIASCAPRVDRSAQLRSDTAKPRLGVAVSARVKLGEGSRLTEASVAAWDASSSRDELIQSVGRRRSRFAPSCVHQRLFRSAPPGHVRLLEHARSLGDVLVVGLNSDRSVRDN